MLQNICKKCVLDASIPGITFDSSGVCNFCNEYAVAKKCEPVLDYESREKKFNELIRSRSKGKRYDCMCLYSGGKDSTYMLFNLVKKYNLNVLAFTLDNWFFPQETFTNINKVLSKLNVDSVVFKPSWELSRALFRLGALEYKRLAASEELAYIVGHICWPCFVQIAMFSTKFAVEKQIPSLVVGTTPGQIRQKKLDLVSRYTDLVDVYKTMVIPMLELLKITNNEQLIKQLDLSFIDKLKVLRVKLLPFYEYIKYDEQEVIDTVKREFGWERPEQTDSCSSNCLLNSFGIELHRKRYKISPYAIPLARDIREGLIDREEALKSINAGLDGKMVANIAKKLDIDLENI